MGIVESPVVFGCGQNRYIISRSIRHRRRLSPWALPSCHGPASISRDVRQYWLNYAALVLALVEALISQGESSHACTPQVRPGDPRPGGEDVPGPPTVASGRGGDRVPPADRCVDRRAFGDTGRLGGTGGGRRRRPAGHDPPTSTPN